MRLFLLPKYLHFLHSLFSHIKVLDNQWFLSMSKAKVFRVYIFASWQVKSQLVLFHELEDQKGYFTA